MENSESMKFLVNNKEYSEFLSYYWTKKQFQFDNQSPAPLWKKTSKLINDFKKSLSPAEFPGIILKLSVRSRDRLYQLIEEAVAADLEKWKRNQLGQMDPRAQSFKKYLNQHYSAFTHADQETIHQLFCRSHHVTLSKQLISSWKDQSELVPRDTVDLMDPARLFIRNTVNNEDLLKTRMQKNMPFLFMDSGYTNFLESGKQWHRLCYNNIHVSKLKGKFDSKRMKIFPSLPLPWREDGEQIVVIEPSTIQCTLFNIDIVSWKQWVVDRLNRHLKRPKKIVFREKIDKKVRENFYEWVQNEDVYCVIHYNSNAGVEALWAGIPVITLGRHITNMVSTNSIESINNLMRPELNLWLKRLSYSQYTIEEIENGTAKDIIERIHYV
jgi:hypothetical protein